MVDLPLHRALKIVGGVRLESTELSIVTELEDQAAVILPGSDGPVNPINPETNENLADSEFSQHDLLPSIGFELKPLEQVKIRGSYTETVARQTFRELTPVQQQEFLGADVFVGNPDLRMSAVKNFDLRLDYTPYDGGLLSISWFRKDITDPIEFIQKGATFTYTTAVNYPEGELSGFEFEVRQDLGHFWSHLAGLSVGANLTLIDSKVQLPPEETARLAIWGTPEPITSRDMSNAPEYLYNLYVTCNLDQWGTKLGLFYTVRGDTLVAGAGLGGGGFVPSVYEAEYATLNFSATQKIDETWQVKFQAKNLTNPAIQTVYRSDYIDGDVVKTSRRKGIDFSISLSAKF
jgi:TonB-dependent receptor